MINVDALRRDVASRRTAKADSEFGSIPGSIPYLQSLLKESLSLDDRHLIWSMLVNEAIRAGKEDLEIELLRGQVAALPPQPIFLSSLALALARRANDATEALMTAGRAVSLALQEDRQVRHSYTVLARVAASIHDVGAFREALSGLIADRGNQRSEDSPYEFDFVETDLPIEPELLNAYRDLRND
jgi:hypothetical protein